MKPSHADAPSASRTRAPSPLLRLLAGTCAIALALPALAQPGGGTVPAAATMPSGSGTAFDGLSARQQAALFSKQVASGELARLPDDQLLAVLNALQPETPLLWAKAEMNRYPEYEYWMTRQERLNGQWQDQPARMMIRYRHSPRQLYARWLPGGSQAGQEILYDETQRKDEMYGHLGGLMGFTSMWIALDGTIARAQSNHTVRDLGFQYVVAMLERNAGSLRAAGLTERFTRAEVVQEQGMRMVALTWELPAGAPRYYAKRVQLMLDLKNPWPRVETAWDTDGNMAEKIVFEKAVRKTFDAGAFDARNSDYRF